jgi:anthranilate synthase component 1
MADVTGSEILRRIDYRPDLAFSVHRHFSHRYPFLLESAASGTPQGRYDILFAAPEDVLTLDADGRLAGPGAERRHDFLNALNGWWQQEHVELAPSDRPFRGGWFLFLAYELAGQIEPTLRLSSRGGELPIALAARVRSGLVADHATRTAWVFAESECADRLTSMTNDVEHVARERELPSPDGTLLRGELLEEPPGTYLRSIAQAKQYIRDGDIFQANLSREWQGSLRPGVDASDVYARLRAANPGPFAGIMRWGDHAVISSSPERLLMVRDHVAQTRPIAGTRPRGEDARADERLSAELIGHPKERAEHVMLIDLERNDLGRVCMPGTVSVNELMVIETYAHVHHIVSNVRGRLRFDVLPGDALRAVFPGGTITGCPKVRCMEIIDELEPEPRRSYTGSIGYLNRDGSLDSNILIRTLELVGDRLTFRAGGGIVADSEPEREVQETRAKARGLKLALIGDSP